MIQLRGNVIVVLKKVKSMLLCLSIEQISAVVGIITPFVLLFWFRYIRKQNFNNEFLGIYAGYMDIESAPENKGTIESGLIMNIRDVLSSGFFRGEFDYRKNIATRYEDTLYQDGIYTFYGKINYRLYFPKPRHALKHKENRIYKGRVTIVMRLDFQFETQDIQDFSQEEYDFIFYRELRALKFSLSKASKNHSNQIPNKFILNKSLGLNFEPYKNVKETIFRGFTRADTK